MGKARLSISPKEKNYKTIVDDAKDNLVMAKLSFFSLFASILSHFCQIVRVIIHLHHSCMITLDLVKSLIRDDAIRKNVKDFNLSSKENWLPLTQQIFVLLLTRLLIWNVKIKFYIKKVSKFGRDCLIMISFI